MVSSIAKNLENLAFRGPTFSVCTLLTSDEQYERMLKSFLRLGFDEDNSEFIYADNRKGNAYDAAQGLNAAIARSKGRYIICCHQDVELIDEGFVELKATLERLTALDPLWGVAGNAGQGDAGPARRISDPYGEDVRVGALPALVHSLDENFLVLRRDYLIGFSVDAGGFHLYGTDLCLQAELRGLKAYVIDFHLRHHSRGNADDSYFDSARRLEAKYAHAFRSRAVRTTFKPLLLTGNWWRAQAWRYKKWQRERQLRKRRRK